MYGVFLEESKALAFLFNELVGRIFRFMYSYQHRYHAGSFADLHKHLILLSILENLQQKPAPFCVLDAFAGEGLYDLASKESQKIKEYAHGFGQILQALHPPPLIKKLLEIAAHYPSSEESLIYPGSPALIQHYLREQDRAIFIENHPQAFTVLQNNFGRVRHIHLHKRDAIEGLNALIPFKEKRGLVFIDPSYEVKEEYQTIGALVPKLYAKFPTGIYVIWYPILKEGYHQVLLKALDKAKLEKTWCFEWSPFKNAPTQRMQGSGIFVINPPWKMQSTVQVHFEYLKTLNFSKP